MGFFDKVNEIENDRKINKKVNKFFENEDYLNRLKIRYSHASIDSISFKEIISYVWLNQSFMSLLVIRIKYVKGFIFSIKISLTSKVG